jgi:hypothetical protein
MCSDTLIVSFNLLNSVALSKFKSPHRIQMLQSLMLSAFHQFKKKKTCLLISQKLSAGAYGRYHLLV